MVGSLPKFEDTDKNRPRQDLTSNSACRCIFQKVIGKYKCMVVKEEVILNHISHGTAPFGQGQWTR